ncbi:hypothetical protein C0J52_21884 [Blattella germanica]|nr:hypothetical protein C0J52_21884 [Blattella germanica]
MKWTGAEECDKCLVCKILLARLVYTDDIMKMTCILLIVATIWACEVSSEPVWDGRGDLIDAVTNFVQEGTQHFEEEPHDQENILPEYDFIIVGAGTAGCTLANRLSEIPEWKILLIEAGGKENYVMDIPLLISPFHFSEANWKYLMEPTGTVCLAMKDNKCRVPRGKVMGGSSTINFMLYTRGNKHDYDNWEKLGNPGWGYKDVLPYFLKLENMTIPEFINDKAYHSTSGPLPVSYAPYRTPLAKAFQEAGVELGYKPIDYNAESQIGISYVQSTTFNGTRWSASRSYLHPIRDRKNLHVKKWSLVTKVLMDPSSKMAVGVEFLRDKRYHRVMARKEVILSAGAVNSPQILMLSGIGPEDHLNHNNISLVKDLKVGHNLMDHIGVMSINFVLNQSVSLRQNDLLNGTAFKEYMAAHTGPFTVPGASEGIAFLDTKRPQLPDGDPDLEFVFFSSSFASEHVLYKSQGIKQSIYNKYYKPIEKYYTWSGVPIVLKPKNRGRILLRSNKPTDKPVIFLDFFKDRSDLDMLLVGVKKMLEFSNTSALLKYGSRLHDLPLPNCEHLEFGSDDYWECVLRHFSFPIWHLSGTCKMGPDTDPTAVVDSRLNVYGVKGLRVIDASIMPVLPSAHTNAPTTMIAEKAADMVKQDWGFGNNFTDHHQQHQQVLPKSLLN